MLYQGLLKLFGLTRSQQIEKKLCKSGFEMRRELCYANTFVTLYVGQPEIKQLLDCQLRRIFRNNCRQAAVEKTHLMHCVVRSLLMVAWVRHCNFILFSSLSFFNTDLSWGKNSQ